LLVGIGCGIILYTLTPILPEYWGSHSGLAQGGQMAAAAAGGVCLSMVTPELLDAVGTKKTLGIFSGMSVVVCTSVSLLAQPPRKFKRRSSHLVTWRDFEKPVFTLLFLANLIQPLTVAIPMTFGPEFSESLHYSDKMGTLFLMINSAVGCPFRVANGYMSDKIGHLNMLLLTTALYTLGTWVLWLSAAQTSNGTLWIIFTVLHGIVNGSFNTVINSIQRRLFGAEMYFPYNGAMTSIRGVGYVVGVPAAGALVNHVRDIELSGEDFVKPIVYTGVLLLASLLCLVGVRVMDAMKNGWMWKR
jgi:nitrate/nitrite transporter NarK